MGGGSLGVGEFKGWWGLGVVDGLGGGGNQEVGGLGVRWSQGMVGDRSRCGG